VTYAWSPNSQANGASVSLTIEKAGCSAENEEVAVVYVNPYPNASINGATSNLCVSSNGLNITRTFQPQAAPIPGATYEWDFGPGAVPATAVGYGPHTVYYTTTGSKVVELMIDPNYPTQSCPDSATISFTVVQCSGNIAGSVRDDEGNGFQGIQVALFKDVNTDGSPDTTVAIATAITQSNGAYAFVSVATGHYVIKQMVQPSGY